MEIKKIPNARPTPVYTEYKRQETEPLDEYMAQFQEPGEDPKPKRKGLKIVLLLLGLLLLAAIVGAIVYMLKQPRPEAADQAATTAGQAQPTEVPKAAAHTKEFDSAKFQIRVAYPEDWKLEEAEDGKRFSVLSPVQELSDVSGKPVKGQVVFAVRDTITDPLAEFKTPSALAVLASEKITYVRPSQVQRGQTYISLLDFSETGALDGIYVTGDAGYQKNQIVPKSDIAKVNPIISVTFRKCASDDCVQPKEQPLSLDPGLWQDHNVFEQVRSMLESIYAY